MAAKLINRGAEINYVNRNGNTALHLCIEHELTEAVKFLLDKQADPHIADMEMLDSCDRAKKTGLARKIPVFNNCNPKKKIKGVPSLADTL